MANRLLEICNSPEIDWHTNTLKCTLKGLDQANSVIDAMQKVLQDTNILYNTGYNLEVAGSMIYLDGDLGVHIRNGISYKVQAPVKNAQKVLKNLQSTGYSCKTTGKNGPHTTIYLCEAQDKSMPKVRVFDQDGVLKSFMVISGEAPVENMQRVPTILASLLKRE